MFQSDGETSAVSGDTMVYIAPHQKHAIKNSSPQTSLKFLSIWWD
ncbi:MULTISPECIES: hypothetical protein [unclassified Rhizobium]|nr:MULTISPECIES: hypothetical protein [unclassified Rhizobium]